MKLRSNQSDLRCGSFYTISLPACATGHNAKTLDEWRQCLITDNHTKQWEHTELFASISTAKKFTSLWKLKCNANPVLLQALLEIIVPELIQCQSLYFTPKLAIDANCAWLVELGFSPPSSEHSPPAANLNPIFCCCSFVSLMAHRTTPALARACIDVIMRHVPSANLFMLEQPCPLYRWKGGEICLATDKFTPVDSQDIIEWRTLFASTAAPLYLDESMCDAEDIRLATSLLVDDSKSVDTTQQPPKNGVNIKLEKSGGIRGALHAILAANRANLCVWMGTMVASTLNCSAVASLLPLATFGCGDIDGSLLVSQRCQQFFGGARFAPQREIHSECIRLEFSVDTEQEIGVMVYTSSRQLQSWLDSQIVHAGDAGVSVLAVPRAPHGKQHFQVGGLMCLPLEDFVESRGSP